MKLKTNKPYSLKSELNGVWTVFKQRWSEHKKSPEEFVKMDLGPPFTDILLEFWVAAYL